MGVSNDIIMRDAATETHDLSISVLCAGTSPLFLYDLWYSSFIRLLLLCLGRQSYFRYASCLCVHLSFDLYEIA
jgi:hypothetical protein